MSEKCDGCDHHLGEHFQSVDGKVRCLHSSSGVSSSGVIGLPWTSRCDCVDYVSLNANAQKKRRKQEEADRDAEFKRWVKAVEEKVK